MCNRTRRKGVRIFSEANRMSTTCMHVNVNAEAEIAFSLNQALRSTSYRLCVGVSAPDVADSTLPQRQPCSTLAASWPWRVTGRGAQQHSCTIRWPSSWAPHCSFIYSAPDTAHCLLCPLAEVCAFKTSSSHLPIEYYVPWYFEKGSCSLNIIPIFLVSWIFTCLMLESISKAFSKEPIM